MVKFVYKVALTDFVLLVALYQVFQDLAWRTYYAGTPHASAASGYTPSFSYSLFTRTFTMGGGSLTLVSPPTLDWVQLLVCLLVAVNAWLVYSMLRTRQNRQVMTPQAAVNV